MRSTAHAPSMGNSETGFPSSAPPAIIPSSLRPFGVLDLIQNYRAIDTMVKIRLTRGGAKKRPFYHIIVTDQRNKRDGRAIERLGFYNPIAAGAEPKLQLDTERVKHWVGHGAQMTDKVRALVKEASAQTPAAAA
jgi:small subunit ribosomal protein S16